LAATSGWTIDGVLDRLGRLRGPDDDRRAQLEKAVLELLAESATRRRSSTLPPTEPDDGTEHALWKLTSS
jgi:hypothetical protein